MTLMIIFDFDRAAAVEQVTRRRLVATFHTTKRGTGFMEGIMDRVCSSSTYVHASLIALESEWCVICQEG